MPKGYMISAHRSEAGPNKRVELAGLTLMAAGGRFLAGGDFKVMAKENGIAQRPVLMEFDSFDAYERKAYQLALEATFRRSR